MIASLEYLIAHSGDSMLRHYRFENGFAELTLELSEIDACVKILVQTDTVAAGKLSSHEDSQSICRLELIDLLDVLQSKDGYYMSPCDFPALMRHRKNAVTLGYGRKIGEARWILSAVGYSRLFSCLVAHLDAISWHEVDDATGSL